MLFLVASSLCLLHCLSLLLFFFFNDTATTEIYTLSLHDALPIWSTGSHEAIVRACRCMRLRRSSACSRRTSVAAAYIDRKSTRLNSSHANISYAVFCLKKKKQQTKKKKTPHQKQKPHKQNTILHV